MEEILANAKKEKIVVKKIAKDGGLYIVFGSVNGQNNAFAYDPKHKTFIALPAPLLLHRQNSLKTVYEVK